MFPIRDDIRPNSRPIVNWLIIGINTAVFLYQVRLPSFESMQFIQSYGLVPDRFWQSKDFIQLVTSIFLHAGWFHFLSNMWMLAIFGDAVEDRLGKTRYVILYISGGLTAGLLQAAIVSTSSIPTIGASGAIAGVLGGYLLLAPRAKVLTLIPVGFFAPWLIHVPALFYLGFWFLSQVFAGVNALNTPGEALSSGIAWWAHIGGFVLGVMFILIFVRPEIKIQEEEIEPPEPEIYLENMYPSHNLETTIDEPNPLDMDLFDDQKIQWTGWKEIDIDLEEDER